MLEVSLLAAVLALAPGCTGNALLMPAGSGEGGLAPGGGTAERAGVVEADADADAARGPQEVAGGLIVARAGQTDATRQPERWSPPEQRRQSGRGGEPDSGGARPPLAMINGQAVSLDEIFTPLAEAAGGVVLEEILLDRALAARADESGVRITTADLERERLLLVDALAEGDRQQGTRLLDEVRRRRGLGEDRFRRLLERNARARGIVTAEYADRLEVTEAMIEQEHRRRFGPRYQARLITITGAADAQAALQRIRDGEASFGDVAVEMSTDVSASRGGLLEPISPVDERYPAALREVLPALAVGEVSDLIALDGQYALLQMVRVLPDERASRPLDDARREMLRSDLRLARQRLEMELLIRDLVRSSDIIVFDPTLNNAWDDQVRGDQ